MSNHTSEPWELRGQHIIAPNYGGRPGLDMTIASVNFAGSMANEEGQANGFLLAAAPELLKACLLAIDWLADKGVPIDHPEAVGIRAAIAKAEERK